MKKNDIFETSLIGGFNKVDVINYLEGIQQEKEKLVKEIFAEKESNKNLINELTEEKSREKTNFAILANKKDAVVSYKQKLSVLETSIEDLEAQKASILDRISEIESEESKYKNSDKAEELMNQSKKMANSLINESKRNSDLKLQKAEIECNKILNDASIAVENINKDLSNFITNKRVVAETLKNDYQKIKKQIIDGLVVAEEIMDNVINKNKF